MENNNGNNGKKSRDRKLKFAYFAAVLITLGFVATGFAPLFQATFSTFVAGILATSGILSAANVVQKKVTKDVYMKELELSNGE